MKNKHKYRIAGVIAGAVNGLFGGGGGIPLLVLLTRWAKLEEKKAFATCVAVIFPLCVVSAVVYFLRCALPLAQALPYLVGGAAGGLVAAGSFKTCRMSGCGASSPCSCSTARGGTFRDVSCALQKYVLRAVSARFDARGKRL